MFSQEELGLLRAMVRYRKNAGTMRGDRVYPAFMIIMVDDDVEEKVKAAMIIYNVVDNHVKLLTMQFLDQHGSNMLPEIKNLLQKSVERMEND